ncbi:MAG: serine hydrolase [Planctomycetes bacterium]|nr:serine hydrolase [Planctomycetota bacterium]
MFAATLVLALAAQRPVPLADDPELVAALRAHPGSSAVVEAAATHRAQVLLATIGKDAKERLVLERRGFRVDAEYFYPASSIKFLAAIAALEDLNTRRVKEPRLTEDTPLVFHPLFAGEVIEDTDPSHLESGKITLRQEIRKLFLVSDNPAFNRLYEYLGQDGLARSLGRAGLSSARILHRLSESRTEDENRRAPRLDFQVGEREVVTIPERASKLRITDLKAPGVVVGTARVEGTRTIAGGMSFARKNAITLVELLDAWARLVEPGLVLDGEPWAITPAQRDALLAIAAEYPADSRNPRYPRAEYPDSWGKPLLPGLERVAPQSAWRVANKIGRAYGFTVDVAWVLHVPSGRGSFVAATVYTNANGVLNDGQYEYEALADPFFAALGEIVGRELAR